MKFAAATCLLLALTACAPQNETLKTPPPFEPALSAHLAAIEARDLEAFKATITSGDDLEVIFPNGEVLASTSEVIAFHEEWFADPDWRWDGEVVKTEAGADMAYALVRYDYRDTPDGAPRTSWLALIFGLEDDEWRLIHDQNTRIAPPEVPAPAAE